MDEAARTLKEHAGTAAGSELPIVAVMGDRRLLGPQPFHVVGEKYLVAVVRGAGAVPLVLPALQWRDYGPEALLDRIDGVLLTGSPSNVAPRHYGGEDDDLLRDAARDETSLPLVRGAVERGVPLLAICRGFQEMNVAYGGTLAARLHERPDHIDHREQPGDPFEKQYAPVHIVRLAGGGLLRRLAGTDEIVVNSLHGQGVDRLGAGLVVEARAPDGVIEAFRVERAPSFAVGVQWHPEWRVLEQPLSRPLFESFGAAARECAARRRIHYLRRALWT